MGLFDNIYGAINTRLNQALSEQTEGPFVNSESLAKAEELLAKRQFTDAQGEVKQGRKGLMIDPFFAQGSTNGLFKPKRGSCSNEVLKLASRSDAVAGIIIDTRANQVAASCHHQKDHYDLGFEFKTTREDLDYDEKEVAGLVDFVVNCGRKEDRKESDKLTFDRWGYMVANDFLRYGYAGIERDWTRDGRLYSFLPLPGESIYYADPSTPDGTLRQEIKTYNDSLVSLLRDYTPMDDDDQDTEGKVEYVQRLGGRISAFFTAKELIFAKYTDDNDVDLNGYVRSPLEKAIMMITNHVKVDNHQSMFFTHGMASRGVLVIRGDISQQNLKTLQSQWHQVTGSANAWKTPVMGVGEKGAMDWINLQPTNRDMEFAAYQDYLLRVIHGCFAISPIETGFEYLSKGTEQKSMSESSNEWKLTDSRDRGLRPILNRIEMIINEEVLPYYDKALSEKYRFCFAGLDAETRVEETQRLQADTALHTTLNEARKEARKEPLKAGGNLILNPIFLQTAKESMPFGLFCEMFMGLDGASQRPDLQFFANPFWFQWQTMQQQILQQQASAEVGVGEVKVKGEKTPQDKANEEEAERQNEAMAMAAQQYMEANPELFKSSKANLAKSEVLAKSKVMANTIEPIAKRMLKGYQTAGNKLVDEVLEILKAEELLADDHNHTHEDRKDK